MNEFRYSVWQFRDFLRSRAPLPVAIALIFLGPFAYESQRRLSGTDGIVRNIVAAVILAASVLSVAGMVSFDVSNNFDRLLFAKPVRRHYFYVQGLFVHFIGFLCVVLTILCAHEVLFRGTGEWELLPWAIMAFLTISCPGFFLSALSRHDGVVLLLLLAIAYPFAEQLGPLKYALPPGFLLQHSLATGSPSPIDWLYAVLYGALNVWGGKTALSNDYSLFRHR